jgi:hypothetical protein
MAAWGLGVCPLTGRGGLLTTRVAANWTTGPGLAANWTTGVSSELGNGELAANWTTGVSSELSYSMCW